MTDAYDLTFASGDPTPGRRKNNFTATVDPSETDDTTEGYEEGSRWLNTVDGIEWRCVSPAEDDAFWTVTSPPSARVFMYETFT